MIQIMGLLGIVFFIFTTLIIVLLLINAFSTRKRNLEMRKLELEYIMYKKSKGVNYYKKKEKGE